MLVGSALKSAIMSSVVATPVAVTVTVEAQAPEAIALVPRVAVPLAIVVVLPLAGGIHCGADPEPSVDSTYPDVPAARRVGAPDAPP